MNKKTGVILLIILILTGVLGYYTYTNFFVKKAKEEVKEVSKIDNYGYTLYDNQSKEYKKMFEELNTVLLKEEIDYNKYVELISKMFIIDFYTLDNKLTNLNIGGVDFVHSSIVSNFKEKAKDTMYKYVESNVYGDRKQELPVVSSVNVDDITQKSFKYGKNIDSKAYYVKVRWSYKKDLGYETSKTLVFGHEDKKLALLQML